MSSLVLDPGLLAWEVWWDRRAGGTFWLVWFWAFVSLATLKGWNDTPTFSVERKPVVMALICRMPLKPQSRALACTKLFRN